MNAEGVGLPDQCAAVRVALVRDIASDVYNELPQDVLRSLHWVAEGRSWDYVVHELLSLGFANAAKLSVLWGWQERHVARLAKGDRVPNKFQCIVPGRNATSRWNEDLEFLVLKHFLPSFAREKGNRYVFREKLDPPDFSIVAIGDGGEVLPASGIGLEVAQGTTEHAQTIWTQRSRAPGPVFEFLDPLPVRQRQWVRAINDSARRKLKKAYRRSDLLQRSQSSLLFLLIYPNTGVTMGGHDYDDPHNEIRCVMSNLPTDPFDRICLVYGRDPWLVWVKQASSG